jgi:hypothetical protein
MKTPELGNELDSVGHHVNQMSKRLVQKTVTVPVFSFFKSQKYQCTKQGA